MPRYAEGEECPEELVINFTVAQWSSNTVRDCITMFGARIIEVIIVCSCHLLFSVLSCLLYCRHLMTQLLTMTLAL